MPFQSEKQRRFLFARKPEVAKKFVEHSKGMSEGGPIEGEAVVKGNSPLNDQVKICVSPGETVISREDIPSLLEAVKKDKSGNLDKVKLDLTKSTEILMKEPYKDDHKANSGVPKSEKIALNPIEQIINKFVKHDPHISFRIPTDQGKTVPGVMIRHSFAEGGPVEPVYPTYPVEPKELTSTKEPTMRDKIVNALNQFHETIKANHVDGMGELGDSTKGLKKIMMDKQKLRDLHKLKTDSKKNGDSSVK